MAEKSVLFFQKYLLPTCFLLVTYRIIQHSPQQFKKQEKSPHSVFYVGFLVMAEVTYNEPYINKNSSFCYLLVSYYVVFYTVYVVFICRTFIGIFQKQHQTAF